MTTELPDQTADVTLTTEVSAVSALPFEGRGIPVPEEDRTVLADPVEQAILVDRTRLPRRSAVHQVKREPPAVGDATVVTTAVPDAEPEGEPEAVSAEPPVGSTAITAVTDLRTLAAVVPDVPPDEREEALASAMDSQVELSTQRIIGNYRVLAPLAPARGCPRLLAEHRSLGFPVAIKLLAPELAGSPEAENRFFAEAMVTSRIAHAGVPMVLDFGHAEGGAYLAMEYVEGETLAACLAGGGRFTLEQVLEIGAQAAGILAAAHASGVLHRDITPETIHLCPDTVEVGGLQIKVSDFGVARDEPAIAGSPWYIAPELSLAVAEVDTRADIHALGCVLYHLLAGRPPFVGPAVDVVQQRRNQDPPPPSAHRPDVPRPLDALVHRMVARRAQDRPDSMAQVERELRGFLVARDVTMATTPAWQRAGGWLALSLQRARASVRGGWSSGPSRGRPAFAALRAAAIRHPRWSVACIAAAAFAGAFGLFVALL